MINILVHKILSFKHKMLYEYISNRMISRLPCGMIRLFFYRHVLHIHVGKSTWIAMGAYIYASYGDFYIGNNCAINDDCIFDRRGGIYIGNNVNISRQSAIYTAGHIINSPVFQYYEKKVHICDYVWLGTRSMIMPGVSVGKGAVVLPGAIVTHDVGEYEIVGGVPAKRLGMRSKKLIYNLDWKPTFI